MYRLLFSLIVALCALPVVAKPESVTLRNSDGAEIICIVTAVTKERVSITREDGQKFEFPIKTLDEDSRKLVESLRIELLKPVMEVKFDKEGFDESKLEFEEISLRNLDFKTTGRYYITVKTEKPGEHRFILRYYIFDGKVMRRGRKLCVITPERPFSVILEASNQDQKVGTERYFQLMDRGILRERDYPFEKECVVFLTDTEGKVIQDYSTNYKCKELLEENADELM